MAPPPARLRCFILAKATGRFAAFHDVVSRKGLFSLLTQSGQPAHRRSQTSSWVSKITGKAISACRFSSIVREPHGDQTQPGGLVLPLQVVSMTQPNLTVFHGLHLFNKSLRPFSSTSFPKSGTVVSGTQPSKGGPLSRVANVLTALTSACFVCHFARSQTPKGTFLAIFSKRKGQVPATRVDLSTCPWSVYVEIS